MVLQFNTPTDRMMARVAITIFTLGALYGIYSLGPPLYWRFYATVYHPFEDSAKDHSQDLVDDDPFSAAVMKEFNAKKGDMRVDI